MSIQYPGGNGPDSPWSDVALAQPDPGAGLALAGFLCGLLGFSAALFATFFFLASYVATFFVSRPIPGLTDGALVTSGEEMLLLIAAFPVALVGLVLSTVGRRSTSRRRLALAGIILSLITLLPFFVALLIVFLSWSRCAGSCL